MPHVLEQKIAAVRRRVRRLLLLKAFGWLAAIVLASGMTLGLADYLFRFEDRGLRLISSLALTAVSGWAVLRFFWPVLRSRFSDVELALRLEQRLQIPHDRLASALRFLGQPEDDVFAGSAALRRTVIAEATAEVERLNLDDAIEPRAARPALGAALAAILVLSTLAVFDPSAAGTALIRLVAPWGSRQWPKQNHLVFVDPVRRLAAGQTFEVQVKDAQDQPLPDEVFIQYRFSDSPSAPAQASERMRLTNDALLARKENVTRPFSYRAVGGDDHSMPWIDVAIVEPPHVEQLTLTLHYPPYTGWPPEAAEPHLRALVGTRVDLDGHLDKPVTSVNICVDDSPAIAARLSDDGRHFSLSGENDDAFKIERSGAYWIELVDAEGFSSGDQTRYEIRAVEDFTPTVSLDRPRPNGFVTPSAKLPVRLIAKDDLALQQVTLRLSRSDRSQEDAAEIVVFQGPPRPIAKAADSEASDLHEIEHSLDLAALELKPGTQLTLYATASDYYPHQGQSEPHRLSVITPDELRDRLSQRQTSIVAELARILKLQRDARSMVAEAGIQQEQVGRFKKQDLDRLQGAELLQQQIERGLVSPGEGVLGQIAELLDDLKHNDIDSPDMDRQMQTVLGEIERLARDHLPLIGGDLTAALKAAQVELSAGETSDSSRPSTAKAPLASAGLHQDEVIQTLERLTESLAEWDNYRRFHREIATIRRQQEEIQRESTELAKRTLTKAIGQLSAQERADLEKLASRQLDLARQFDKIQQRMQRAAEEVSASDPLSAGSVADALAQARDQALAQKMHDSGRQVAANQFGQAIEAQRRATDGLQEVLDILANRREHEFGRLVKKLRDAQDQLAEIQQQQQGLQKKWQGAAEETDENVRRRELERLSRQQQDTAEATERLARRLERLQAEGAGEKASQSGGKMNRAGQQGQQDQAAAAADAAAEAERDLEQAQQELAKRLAEAEADLAQEQMARLEDHLKAIADAQGKLLDETRHYADVEQSQGALTRAQAISVADLGKHQHSIEQDTVAMAAKLVAAPVFRLAFDDAARNMARSAQLLEEHQTGAPTQRAEKRAFDLIAHALNALKPVPKDPLQPPPPDDASGKDSPPDPQNANTDATQALAELKLLKWMQDDVNLRTKALDEEYRDADELPPDARQQYRELSEQQGAIADLVLQLISGS
jgi:hypothetical protein